MNNLTRPVYSEDYSNPEYEGLVPLYYSGFLPLYPNLFVRAPATQPYRPVLRVDAEKFDGIGEYQIFRQFYAFETDKRFSSGNVKRVAGDVTSEKGQSALSLALIHYDDLMRAYHSDICVALARSTQEESYGLYKLPDSKHFEAVYHLMRTSF